MLEVFHTDRITVVLYSSIVAVTVKQVVPDPGLLRLDVEGHEPVLEKFIPKISCRSK